MSVTVLYPSCRAWSGINESETNLFLYCPLLYCQYGKVYNNLNETVDGLAEYEVSISNSNAVASGGVKVEDDKDNDLAHNQVWLNFIISLGNLLMKKCITEKS